MNKTLDFEDLVGEKFGATALRAIRALRAARVDFVLVGSAALGKLAQPRHTGDVDFVVRPDQWRVAVKALRGAHLHTADVDPILTRFKDPETRVGVDLMFGTGDPEESARFLARPSTLFGERVGIVRPEHLLWMYLNSPRVQHRADAINLINHGRVDLLKVDRLLSDAGERTLRIKLRAVLREADREKEGT